jgi:hypothetical protein
VLRFFIFILFFPVCGESVYSQRLLDSLYFRSDLIADLESLKQELINSHPGPFEFCDERYFQKVYAASNYAVEDRTTLVEFSLIVANLLNTLRDSHTAIDYGQLLDLQFNGGGYFMPLSLELTEALGSDQILIANDWEQKISPGSELISINGVDTDKLLKRALDYSCIEGDAEDARKSVAVSILTICAGLKIPYASSNQVRVVDFDTGDTVEVSLRGFQRKEFYRERARRHQQLHPSPVQLQLDAENDIAILQVSTFAPTSSRKYRKQIADCFRKINESNHSNLIIDLRNNGGGSSSLVEYLYSFIDTLGYNTPSNVIARNSRLASSRSRLMNSIFADVIMALFFSRDEDVLSFRHFSQLAIGEVDTVYFKTPTRQASNVVFRGPCYVLINGLTASAAVDFTSAFRKRNRGMLVGHQCLGPITGTWGNPAALTLPNSGLRVSIATIRYNYDNTFRYERAGIIPDHRVERSPQDVHCDIDTPVKFVINLIKK